jgi:hypothetical protein
MGALGLGLGLALPAAADPKGDPIDMQCEELESLQIVLNGNGPMTPGHVVGSTRVGIPYKLRVEGTFTPVGGEPHRSSTSRRDRPHATSASTSARSTTR